MMTGERDAACGEGIGITDRGRPATSLLPVRLGDLGRPFRERCTLPEFDALPPVSGDSGANVSHDRDRG
jgi:antitoxin (DNA-binding transcriptional repressor) of toxin-antitoxin stability system